MSRCRDQTSKITPTPSEPDGSHKRVRLPERLTHKHRSDRALNSIVKSKQTWRGNSTYRIYDSRIWSRSLAVARLLRYTPNVQCTHVRTVLTEYMYMYIPVGAPTAVLEYVQYLQFISSALSRKLVQDLLSYHAFAQVISLG